MCVRERVGIIQFTFFFYLAEHPTPSVCVTASLTPSAVIMTGSSVTINCNITFDLQPLEDVVISHFSEDGLHWKRNVSLSSCVGLHQNMTCSYTIEEVTSEGNYTCSFFGVTDTVILAVIETGKAIRCNSPSFYTLLLWLEIVSNYLLENRITAYSVTLSDSACREGRGWVLFYYCSILFDLRMFMSKNGGVHRFHEI